MKQAPVTVGQMHELLSIMTEMKQVVSSHDWEQLSRLDSERLALLRADSKVPHSAVSGELQHRQDVSAAKDSELRAALKEQILALDNEIVSSLQRDRDKLLSENRGLSAQVKAKSVYAQTNSMI